MKHILLSFGLMCSAAVMAAIPVDNSCENPMPVTKDFQETISAAGEYWFSAYTYDLPLGGFFVADDANNTENPIAWVDFSCTTGVYDDALLSDIVTSASGWGVEVPIKFEMTKTIINGVLGHQLMVDDTYRELLSEYGLTYNVQALIKVVFPAAGKISMIPDSIFRNCMNNATYVHVDDTLRILPNDSAKVFVLPYTDWQNDSVCFIWRGTQPAQVFIAYDECGFEPSNTDPDVWDIWTMEDGDTVKLTSAQIKETMEHNGISGLYYTKVLTKGAGELYLEKVPQKAAEGDAVLLPYGEETILAAGDTATLYYFPKTWNKATRFFTPTNNIFKMYVSRAAQFNLSSEDENVVAVYQYRPIEDGHELCLTASEMQKLADKATEDYLYVRFQCIAATSILPDEWIASACAEKTTALPLDFVHKQLRGTSEVYRMNFADWQNYGMAVDWAGNGTLVLFFADTCSFKLSTNNKNIIFYESISKYSKDTIAADKINQLVSHVDADGYVYLQWKSTNNGNLTITSTKPAETEPIPSSTADTRVGNSLSVAQYGDNLLVTTTEDQNIQLFTSLGVLVQSWHQLAGEQYTLSVPRSTMYVLRGKSDVVKLVR